MESVAKGLGRFLGIDGLDAPEHRGMLRLGLLLAVLAMLVRLLFWAYTQRYWEDALITCLHSENAASGLGLTHVRPGEPPLHGFTSPLSVLVPLVGDLMHVGFGVDFLKLVSIPAAGLTILFLLGLGLHPGVRLPPAPLALVMGYAAFEHHQILWGMSGMETQLSTLILLMSLYYTAAWKPVPLGITLGLCMLVRPDYGFWTVIVGVYGLFREPKALLKIVPIALAVYLPWIAFTTLYYGSPIPNTIIAKGLGYPKWWDKMDALNLFTLKRHTWMVLSEQLHVMLGPTFCGHGAGMHLFFTKGPESPIGNLMFGLAVLGTLAILVRRQWSLWPLAACVVAYSAYYVFLVPVIFGWYKVPYLVTLLLLSARGLQALGAVVPHARLRGALLSGFTAAYLALFIGVLPVTFLTEKQIQRDVEDPVRKAAGLYLKARMQPNEAVGCEPLGYMAYYSRGNVYDWPGLASRSVVKWSREHPQPERCLENMLRDLQPEYLFLRDREVLYGFRDISWLRDRYHPIAVFAPEPEKAARIRWLDLNIDTDFRVYEKNSHSAATPSNQVPWPSAPPSTLRNPVMIYNAASRLAQQGRYPEAIAHWERAIELKPDFVDAYHNLAVAHLFLGNKEAARRIVEKMLQAGLSVDPSILAEVTVFR